MCDTEGLSEPHYDINQEREFYKYFQPSELGLSSEFENIGKDGLSPSKPRASPDRALTAFTQLSTLRLNCRRAFISFFDRKYQYIVAEATRSLSLETHSASQPGDELKFGITIVPKKGSLCENTVGMLFNMSSSVRDSSAFVVPDCRNDDRFKDKLYTTDFAFRFYAGVPIVSPKGYTIGSYCVVDDEPREGLSDDDLSFMKDMATTVMVHMDMLRAKTETIKGERMVRGLGSFVEGKSSIDDWWMDPEISNTPGTEDKAFNAARAQQWASKQYSMHHGEKLGAHPDSGQDVPAQNPGMIFQLDTKDQRRESGASEEPVKPIKENPRVKDTENQDTLSIEVKATFGRACRIIREALGVDGVCCFDAKAGHTFGGLIDQEPDERPKRRKLSQDSSVQVSSSDSEGSLHDGQQEDKPCEVLGFSTTEFSSVNGDQASKVTDGMTEHFLRSLLRRFPHGTILQFDESGNAFSEHDTSEETAASSAQSSTARSKKSRKLRSGESAFLQKVFPEARNLAIVPLWDSRQRFFSACVAWTRSEYRVLTSQSELSYLAAFGDSIMAEVSRVDAKIADKAKSDFISSISHELRSPLHGILGSVECLQDSELDPFQENLVHTVETCGKTLLDTIDHLLDFAKINNFTRKGGKNRDGKSKNIALDVDVDLSVVTEEVLETVFAGHDFMKASSESHDEQGNVTSSATTFAQRALQLRRKSTAPGSNMLPRKKAVSVVVDINKAEESHWIFRTQAGAWRRILMNLFGNSLKYTEEGFVQVKLNAEPLPREGKAAKSTVILTVIDSGKGISQDYLNKSLFVPFAQEDSLQPGTGLGLAITAAIIRSMGGTIDVKSEKGHGTEITVKLEMIHAPYSQESLEQSIISSAARRTKGLKIGFVGFDADSFKEKPKTEERSPENARYNFMSSFHRLCQNWFGMDMKIMVGLDQSDADIFLTTEQGLGQIEEELAKVMEKQCDKDAQIAVRATPLLVLCDSATTANMMLHNQRAGKTAEIAEYISQPCGPRKLAKSLVLCLDRQEALNKKGRNPTPLESLAGAESKGRGVETLNKGTSQLSLGTSGAEGKSRVYESRPHDGAIDVKKVGTPHQRTEQSQKSPEWTTSKIASPPSTTSGEISPWGGPKMATPKILRNVLLVDDNSINLQLLVTYIKKTGHNFATAGNGLAAFEAYKEQCESSSAASTSTPTSPTNTKPRDLYSRRGSRQEKEKELRPSPFDFILMDLTMPVMDGLESTRHIRAYERDHNIRPTTVIALTGLASTSAQQEAYGSGVNTFMTKPVKMKDLGNLLDKED